MSNIITKGLKGNWKTILKGFFGGAVSRFVKFNKLTDSPFLNLKLTNRSFVSLKLSTEGGL